jgi:hypothetical protein
MDLRQNFGEKRFLSAGPPSRMRRTHTSAPRWMGTKFIKFNELFISRHYVYKTHRNLRPSSVEPLFSFSEIYANAPLLRSPRISFCVIYARVGLEGATSLRELCAFLYVNERAKRGLTFSFCSHLASTTTQNGLVIIFSNFSYVARNLLLTR